MTVLLFLIPVALLLGGLGMWCFVWAVNSNQFDDLDTVGNRILFDDADAKLRERKTR
jgi:cbb3-type cytochrome oxidase maturation protein